MSDPPAKAKRHLNPRRSRWTRQRRAAAELAELKDFEAEEERRREDEARKHSEANARRAEAACSTAPGAVRTVRHRRPGRRRQSEEVPHGAPPRRVGTGPADASPAR